MIIGTILLAFALPVGIVLVADLLNEQHHSAMQTNHSSL
ncbi:transcriptional regulator [Lysinibacillus cavernae]|nr:transcriptional regulator [Lysinibacillus cavernae]